MMTLHRRLTQTLNEEAGQDFAEYAFLLALIVILVLISIGLYSGTLQALYTYVIDEFIAAVG